MRSKGEREVTLVESVLHRDQVRTLSVPLEPRIMVHYLFIQWLSHDLESDESADTWTTHAANPICLKGMRIRLLRVH